MASLEKKQVQLIAWLNRALVHTVLLTDCKNSLGPPVESPTSALHYLRQCFANQARYTIEGVEHLAKAHQLVLRIRKRLRFFYQSHVFLFGQRLDDHHSSADNTRLSPCLLLSECVRCSQSPLTYRRSAPGFYPN